MRRRAVARGVREGPRAGRGVDAALRRRRARAGPRPRGRSNLAVPSSKYARVFARLPRRRPNVCLLQEKPCVPDRLVDISATSGRDVSPPPRRAAAAAAPPPRRNDAAATPPRRGVRSRAQVGTCYCKKGRAAAMELGLAKLRKKGGFAGVAARAADGRAPPVPGREANVAGPSRCIVRSVERLLLSKLWRRLRPASIRPEAVSTEFPRRRRTPPRNIHAAPPRNVHVAAAASPRVASAECPASRPRRESPPRNVHVAAAASPRLSPEYPRDSSVSRAGRAASASTAGAAASGAARSRGF